MRVWKGLGYRDYLLRIVPVVFQGRALQLLVARREAATSPPLLRLEQFPVPPHAWNEREFTSRIRRRAITRKLAFNRDGRLISSRGDVYAVLTMSWGQWAWMCEQGAGYFNWPHLTDDAELAARFRAGASDAQVEREIAAMLADADSDCAFAWRWMRLSERERDRELVTVERGNLDEVAALLRALLWSDALWHDVAGWQWNVFVGLGSERQFEFDVGVEWSKIENEIETYELSPRLKRGLRLVFEHFQLWQNKRISARVQARRIADGRDTYDWHVPVPIPTAHERLEARLQLRDFLRDKVTPAELAELMQN